MAYRFIRQAAILLASLSCAALAQEPSLTQHPPTAWVQAAADQQVRVIAADGTFPVRYTTHRSSNKGTATRVTIETSQGTISRTFERNGAPLNADDTAAERARLQAILDNPDAWARKQERYATERSYATQLVKLMPRAMIYTYAAGQPQMPGSRSNEPAVAIDFHPDPAFRPPTLASELLTGLAGRMWIDARTQVLLRVEGRIVQSVNFGWGGLLARVYPGGTVLFEQQDAGGGRWIYSHLDENITLREFLVHTQAEKTQIQASDVELIPHPVDAAEAVRMLLAMPAAH